MRRIAAIAATTLLALAVPMILIGNGLWLLMNPWYVHAEYARPGFPDDDYGFTRAQRTELAVVGLRSIQPQNREGVQVLRDARLPGGGPAFDAQEIGHMNDVRRIVGVILRVELAGLAMILVLAIAARFGFARGFLSRALLAGSVLTLGFALTLGLVMLIDFDWFFRQFHLALFEGMTWYFDDTDTLLRLYPDAFWSDFAIVLSVLVLGQALALAGVTWWWRRRGRVVQPPADSAPTAVGQSDGSISGNASTSASTSSR